MRFSISKLVVHVTFVFNFFLLIHQCLADSGPQKQTPNIAGLPIGELNRSIYS